MARDINLMVAITSCRDWKAQFGSSLVGLICNTYAGGLGGRLNQLTVAPAINQSNVAAGRQGLFDKAIHSDTTHLVTLDDDMMFDPDVIEKLIKHDLDFVCANACQKVPDKINGVCLDLNGQRIDSSGKQGIEQVSYGSLAVAAMKMDWIRKMSRPHFEILWNTEVNDGKGGYLGEDHYFFAKGFEQGMLYYCDHDVKVKHIGDYPYAFEG